MNVLVLHNTRHYGTRIEAAIYLLWPDAHVTHAVNCQEGLDRFLSQPVEFVLIEASTLGFNALQAIRRISDVPIIMLIGRTATADQRRTLELGADDYVPKPVHTQALVARMRAAMHRKNLLVE